MNKQRPIYPYTLLRPALISFDKSMTGVRTLYSPKSWTGSYESSNIRTGLQQQIAVAIYRPTHIITKPWCSRQWPPLSPITSHRTCIVAYSWHFCQQEIPSYSCRSASVEQSIVILMTGHQLRTIQMTTENISVCEWLLALHLRNTPTYLLTYYKRTT